MTQKTFSSPFPTGQTATEQIDENTTGSELINILQAVEQAGLTLHSGDDVPTYAKAGTLWIKTNGNNRELRLFRKISDPPVESDSDVLLTFTNGNDNDIEINASSLPVGTTSGKIVQLGSNNKILNSLIDTGEAADKIPVIGSSGKLPAAIIPTPESNLVRKGTEDTDYGYDGTVNVVNFAERVITTTAKSAEELPPGIRQRFFGLVQGAVGSGSNDNTIYRYGALNIKDVASSIRVPTNANITAASTDLSTLATLSHSDVTNDNYYTLCIVGLRKPDTLSAAASNTNDLVDLCFEEHLDLEGSNRKFIRWYYPIGRVRISSSSSAINDSPCFYDTSRIKPSKPLRIFEHTSGNNTASNNLESGRTWDDYERVIIQYKRKDGSNLEANPVTYSWDLGVGNLKTMLPVIGQGTTTNGSVELSIANVETGSFTITGTLADFRVEAIYGVEKS